MQMLTLEQMGLLGRFIQPSVPGHPGFWLQTGFSAVTGPSGVTLKVLASSGTGGGQGPGLFPVYTLPSTHAVRPAFLKKLRTTARANRPQCRSSVNRPTVLSSPSVPSSHVKTTEENQLSALIYLAFCCRSRKSWILPNIVQKILNCACR